MTRVKTASTRSVSVPVVHQSVTMIDALDEQKSFMKRVSEVTVRGKSKLNLMHILSGKDWGSSEETKLKIFRRSNIRQMQFRALV